MSQDKESIFTLLPCKIREDQLVPVKGAEPVVMTWTELLSQVAPGGHAEAQKLKALQVQSYIGLSKKTKEPSSVPGTWVLLNPDRSGNIGWILKKDPTFEKRLVVAYRVEKTSLKSGVQEFSSPNQKSST